MGNEVNRGRKTSDVLGCGDTKYREHCAKAMQKNFDQICAFLSVCVIRVTNLEAFPLRLLRVSIHVIKQWWFSMDSS